ncbi:TlpA disulfide reductase family protein [Marivita sp. GX14005]|uniref:TlpA family protein disulfide reductase n=1 Tax=Marivita sp. GX14005 TaxID=2942276 RepID=UPI00201940A8|nr:TlpA disulfide reductase family protein [Marivita sp. GX14005]MCL3881656.1 TlpA family protein disulfide reductase [Marivita sp. GX14005]
MKNTCAALLYTGLVMLANPALADLSEAEAMREGDMKKLTFHAAPQAAGSSEFMTFEGDALTLAEYEGKWVLLNFWATWCAPCRKEIPMLSELQREFGGERFEVVTIASGRNPPPAMQSFFEEIGVDNLPLHRDPKSALAREMGVLGLPITVILNPEGQEVARMRGDADWASDNARAVLATILNGEAG